MAAPVGNSFWKLRAKHGRDKIFKSPLLLWEACTEYFDHVESNPLWTSKTVQYQGVPVDLPEAKMRAMTIDGLCTFLDIDNSTWFDWRSDKDFSNIVTRVERIIRDQKFSGAAAELLNPNIIARDLGLVDKKETKSSISFENLSDEDLDSQIKALIQ